MEIAFPDFQSLLLALRYSGEMGVRRRTPAHNELNPDNMTYEVFLFEFLLFFSYLLFENLGVNAFGRANGNS